MRQSGLWAGVICALACGRAQEPATELAGSLETSVPVATAVGLGPAPASLPELASVRLPAGEELSLQIVQASADFEIRAVGGAIVYGVRAAASNELWLSSDGARTWQKRWVAPGGIAALAVLTEGVLLADVHHSGQHTLHRSIDGGQTWAPVLSLDRFRMLQSASVAELNGTVFFGEYQVDALEAPVRLWASVDRGATWSVRHTFYGRRHAHAVLAQPGRDALWVMLGDKTGGLLRSFDEGRTFQTVVEGAHGVAVNGVFTDRGLLYGLDNLYLPHRPAIVLLRPDDTLVELEPLPGPSYSVMRLRDGGFLLGVTREVGGDVYPPGDESAHLYGSADGLSWRRLASFERRSPNAYARADARWQLPTGEVLIELSNVKTLPPPGSGYLLVRAATR